MKNILSRFILPFLLGILVFCPLQILLQSLEVIEFQYPKFLGLPLWLPFAVGGGTVLLGFLWAQIDKVLKIELVFSAWFLIYELLFLSAFFGLIVFLRAYPYILGLTLFLMIVVRLTFFHQDWDLLFFLLGACLGPTLELLLTNFHLYTFNDSDLLGMPYWLPLFWGTISLVLRRMAWYFYPEHSYRNS